MKSLFLALLLAVSAQAASADDPLSGRDLVKMAERKITSIDTATLLQRLKKHPNLLLVDVRMPDEVRRMGGTIDAPGNVVIPRGWLEFRIRQYALDADTPIVVYCGANIRSPLAALTLRQMGYRNVVNYADGFIGWKRVGLPVKAP